MLEDIRSVDEYYGKKVIFGIIFTILLIITTLPPILVGSLGPTADQAPSSNNMSLSASLIVSGSVMGGMLLLQYYPIHRVVFYRVPTRRSTGENTPFVFLTLFAMMISVINIAWSVVRVSSSGTGTILKFRSEISNEILKNITTAYSIINIIASVLGVIIDFCFIYVYVARY